MRWHRMNPADADSQQGQSQASPTEQAPQAAVVPQSFDATAGHHAAVTQEQIVVPAPDPALAAHAAASGGHGFDQAPAAVHQDQVGDGQASKHRWWNRSSRPATAPTRVSVLQQAAQSQSPAVADAVAASDAVAEHEAVLDHVEPLAQQSPLEPSAHVQEPLGTEDELATVQPAPSPGEEAQPATFVPEDFAVNANNAGVSGHDDIMTSSHEQLDYQPIEQAAPLGQATQPAEQDLPVHDDAQADPHVTHSPGPAADMHEPAQLPVQEPQEGPNPLGQQESPAPTGDLEYDNVQVNAPDADHLDDTSVQHTASDPLTGPLPTTSTQMTSEERRPLTDAFPTPVVDPEVALSFGQRIERLIAIATTEAENTRHDAQQEADRVREEARLDSEHVIAAAQRQAADIIAAAQRRAADDVAAAAANRQVTEEELAAARVEAEHIVNKARNESAQMRQEIDDHVQQLLSRTHEDINHRLATARAEIDNLTARKTEMEDQLAAIRAMLAEAMAAPDELNIEG